MINQTLLVSSAASIIKQIRDWADAAVVQVPGHGQSQARCGSSEVQRSAACLPVRLMRLFVSSTPSWIFREEGPGAVGGGGHFQ